MSKKATNRITGQQQEVQSVVALPIACPACQSTQRTPFGNTTRLDSSGITACGQRYTAVVWRRTNCKSCGQCYIVRSYENEPKVCDARVTDSDSQDASNGCDARVTTTSEVVGDGEQ